ncbi:MAG: transposase [Marinilabiliaceae bacterium]|nr:transposase [Marinilabiliaceae bacterium]
MQIIRDGYQNFSAQTKDVQLMIDDGPENNNKEMDSYTSSDGINIQKLIGMKDIPQSNSLIEAQNKLLKYQYLFKHQYENINQLRNLLNWVIEDYNNIRPHHALKGLTPSEAYTGKTTDEKELRLKMKQAKQNRITQNTKISCGIC